MAATRLPGTPRLLRALNDRAALDLLLTRGPLTRAQLGEMTGLHVRFPKDESHEQGIVALLRRPQRLYAFRQPPCPQGGLA